MAKTEELYISFEPKNYRLSKAQVLSSQIDLINSIKHLKNLKEFEARKVKLKQRLHQIYESVIEITTKLEKKMPEPNLPRSLQLSKIKEEVSIEIPEDIASIDKELMEIQAKLRELNA